MTGIGNATETVLGIAVVARAGTTFLGATVAVVATGVEMTPGVDDPLHQEASPQMVFPLHGLLQPG